MAQKDIVFVNADKHRRAIDIVALVEGKKTPQKASEIETRNYWTDLLSDEKGDSVAFVYEKLGGLIRSTSEEKAAKERKAEIKKTAGKKRK